MKPYLGIRIKLFCTIILILLISYVTFIYSTIHSYETFVETETQRELEEHLNFAKKQYLVRAEQMRLSLMNPASAAPVQQYLKRRDGRWFRGAIQRWHEILPFTEFLTVIDARKVVVARMNGAASGDRLEIGDLVDRAFHVKKPIISSELISSQQLCREGASEFCQMHRQDEAMAVVVVIPVVDAGGTVLGAFVCGDLLNKDPFLPFQVKGIFGKETELSIFQRGMRIASSLGEEDHVPVPLDPEALATLESGHPYQGPTSFGGRPYISAFDPIVNSRGQVIGSLSVALSLEDLKKVRRESENTILFSAIAGILLSFAIAYVATRRLTAPLRELSRGVEQIEQGDLNLRLAITSRDEFGLLADSFNRMAASLLERDRTINKKTRDLEELNALLKELNNLLENNVMERTTELRREMGMLEAILTSMVEGILVTDHDNNVVLFNPAAQKFFDVVPHRVLNQPVEDLLDVPGFPLLSEYIGEIRSEGDGPVVHEKDLEVRGRKLKINLSPLVEEEGVVAGVVISLRDVTAEEEVDRMKTEFISTVSHELKTPLTSIKGALQFTMQKAKWLTGTERELLSVCLRNTDRLIRLINDILDISKMESGRVDLAFRPLSVGELAVYAIEEIKGLALSRNVTIVNGVGDHLPPVYGDHDRIIQVLTNLLSNAVKFSPESKVIMVSAERQDNYVVVSVADHGKEIQWADRDKLFKKFQQLENADGERRGGTGLGLAICKEIIERHHGRIYYHAGATGGNVFSFTLPVYEEQ